MCVCVCVCVCVCMHVKKERGHETSYITQIAIS